MSSSSSVSSVTSSSSGSSNASTSTSAAATETALAQVSPASVLIGRGRKIKEYPGNQRFLAIVQSYLDAYSNAPTKTKKSLIILKIVNDVRAADNGTADFVKYSDATKQYIAVDEAAARITVAQTLRDELNESYKSSKQQKQRKRLEIKRECIRQARRLYPLQMQGMALDTTTTACMTKSAPLSNVFQQEPLNRIVSPTSTCDFVASFTTSHYYRGNQQYPPVSAMLSLDGILQEAVGMAQGMDVMVSKKNIEQKQKQQDIFTSLFQAFAPSPATVVQEDPFEPKPIQDLVRNSNNNDVASFGSLEEDWEPFPVVIS